MVRFNRRVSEWGLRHAGRITSPAIYIQGEYKRGMSRSYKKKDIRRKKLGRTLKRGMMGILLAPAKLPRITGQMADRIMSYCEVAAIVFVSVLMAHLIIPKIIGLAMVIVTGIVFVALMLTVLVSDYQDKLVEYELYGFRI